MRRSARWTPEKSAVLKTPTASSTTPATKRIVETWNSSPPATAEKPDMSRPNVNETIFVDVSIPSKTKAREKSEARRRISVKPW
jgi:hypothetical protein